MWVWQTNATTQIKRLLLQHRSNKNEHRSKMSTRSFCLIDVKRVQYFWNLVNGLAIFGQQIIKTKKWKKIINTKNNNNYRAKPSKFVFVCGAWILSCLKQQKFIKVLLLIFSLIQRKHQSCFCFRFDTKPNLGGILNRPGNEFTVYFLNFNEEFMP